MKIWDISLTLTESLPVWPGDDKAKFTLVHKMEEGEMVNVTHINMGAHTGTHIDAPCHFLKEGKGVETLPLEPFIGKAYVMENLSCDCITPKELEQANIPPETKRLLIKTKNSNQWVQGASEFVTDYVGINAEGAQALVDRGIELVGVDYLSVAPFEELVPTHEILLKSQVIIVEALNLSAVKPGSYTLHCLPLKIAGADGAPARAILTT